jgi:hypothetical protein
MSAQPSEQLRFVPFEPGDVDVLAPVMKRAFDEDSRRHGRGEVGGPPGYDNGDFLRNYALHPDSNAYKVLSGDTPVGAVIVWPRKSGIAFLGCIFVDTARQDKGLGMAMWRQVESLYPHVKLWRTETPVSSARNVHFYVDKCGFRVVRTYKPRDGGLDTCALEKKMSSRRL